MDWHLPLNKTHTLTRTLGILWILMEKRKVENEDMKDHDENKEATRMDENKEALNTEKMFLE